MLQSICREIGLAEQVDAQGGECERKVSCGQAVPALALNALDFSGWR